MVKQADISAAVDETDASATVEGGTSAQLSAAPLVSTPGKGNKTAVASQALPLRLAATPASDSPAAGASASQLPGANPMGVAAKPSWLGKRIGRFRLIGEIGRGATGKVFRAEDIQLHRLVALKVISSRSSRKRTAVQKLDLFLREARSAARLEHPNIVSVYEIASASDIHFIAMELIEGGNLKDLVLATGPLDVSRACQLCCDAAEGLQHAHDHGVVHRDLKPANLMLSRTGRCKLADFGLARIGDTSDGIHGMGAAVGTPHYVAPEIIEGEEATALSDIYSLGATLFYLLTGVPPFPGDNAREVLRQHLEELPPDIRMLRPDIPESLALTIWRALSKQPTARCESAGHFARSLRLHTLQTENQAFGDVPSRQPSQLKRRRSPREWALAGLLGGGAALVLLTVITIFVSRLLGTEKAKNPGMSEAVDSKPLMKPGALIAAADTALLHFIASQAEPTGDGVATIEGTILRIEPTRDGADQVIVFRGVDRKRGLLCILRAGAIPEAPLPGSKIRVRGPLELWDDQPLIDVRTASQIIPIIP